MRIRKNTKLSPLLFTCSPSLLQNGSFPVEIFQTHVCQLNQSPWDVIPFASNNSSSIQFQEQDIFTNGDSFGALDESVDSMMETDVVDIDNNKPAIENFEMMVFDDNKVVNNNGGSNKGLKRNWNGGGGIEAPRRGRGRPKKSVGSASGSNNNVDNSVDVNVVTCSEGLDCVEDYEDDYDDSGDDNGNRRTRKPVKERSLKSLM
ncbi:hypothetical protein MtrunA17_Chr8g0348571 [Medicago truncatula]|uniref:Uncharacterized protein n=1 Tax=Medicago truncatula TaxID=3880 RepID=A0A396GET7_MEDTR|nr:uncharacterized protein LOC25500859 isoform X1 [Medicago truncatula]RHN39866.1 hypothetical protein MtrunA17_Chr8g0348571 [Medicago truncatula]